MTGELTLTGRVLAIGGLKEKTTAAWSAGVTKVLIPWDNRADLEEIDPIVRDGLLFVPCKTAEEVLRVALCAPSHIREAAMQTNLTESTEQSDTLPITPGTAAGIAAVMV
jgi:ATP-dependent Lon protease